MNNAAGPQALIEAVGQEWVLLGFPLPGGKRDRLVMRIVPDKEDAWLRHHVAIVGPLAAALCAANVEQDRLARTRDALVLDLRGMREAIAALKP